MSVAVIFKSKQYCVKGMYEVIATYPNFIHLRKISSFASCISTHIKHLHSCTLAALTKFRVADEQNFYFFVVVFVHITITCSVGGKYFDFLYLRCLIVTEIVNMIGRVGWSQTVWPSQDYRNFFALRRICTVWFASVRAALISRVFDLYSGVIIIWENFSTWRKWRIAEGWNCRNHWVIDKIETPMYSYYFKHHFIILFSSYVFYSFPDDDYSSVKA